MRRAYRENTTEAFHEWRKRVKVHRYHTRLLRDVWQPVLEPWREQLHALSDLLGDDHDLAVFQQTVLESDLLVDFGDRESLPPLIVTRRAELQAQAAPVGARLLAEKPARLVDRHRVYWDASRSRAIVRSALHDDALGSS
jgi:CHAD domain-containing protein